MFSYVRFYTSFYVCVFLFLENMGIWSEGLNLMEKIWITSKFCILHFAKWLFLIICQRDSLKSLTIYQQLWSFFVFFLQNLCHFKSLTASKSMPPKSINVCKEKWYNVLAGTLEPMSIKDILYVSVLEYLHNT